ncbi:hypothetical protein CEXT_646751 [Caerostris extrusa]|uniref:Uncharacterized protein n=1 Tax=Caerostris extrusa TaxID=172846 RepID=A0AAV4QZS3_CAEEX|nr:hypothetical protein CEXT_646751 [Caerostris extrusa]
MYREYIENTHSEYSSSISDLNSYIVSTCCREDLFGRLPFFDRIFFTGQFLIMLGDFCMTRGMFTVDKLFRCVYLSWAIHLDRFSKEYEPSVRYKGTETFDELWKIFRFKSFVTNIDNIREIENLEKFRQLPVEKTEGVSHAAREVCQNTIPTPTDFQSSGPETTNNDHGSFTINHHQSLENHLENVEQNMEDSEKMDDFCVGSSSTTPCLAGRSAASNSASAEYSASKYKEEQKKESESDDVQDMLRMLLVLGERRYPIREANLAIF